MIPLDSARTSAEDAAPAARESAEQLREPADRDAYEALKARAQETAAADPGEASSRPSVEARRPGKRGRKPDPKSERAPRTYREMLARATTAEERAEAHAFAKAAGIPLFLHPESTTTPKRPAPGADAEVPKVEPEADEEDAAPAGKPRPKFMGQDAARVEMYAGAILPVVETLVDLARARGVDCTKPRTRTIFKGIQGLEREITADPVGRIVELLSVEAAERFTPKAGADVVESKADRRFELAILGVVAAGPLALPLLGPLRQLPAFVVGGIHRLVSLATRKKKAP